MYRVVRVDQSIYTPMENQQTMLVGNPFLDPAVIGVKRSGVSPRGAAAEFKKAEDQQQSGIDFIKTFHLIILRHRQCSFIEAHMIKSHAAHSAGGGGQGLVGQNVLYWGH